MLSFYETVDNSIAKIDSIKEGCWVNAVSPTADEIDFLIEKLNIERDFLNAALDDEESSRIEKTNEQTLVIVDTPMIETKKDLSDDTLIYTTMPIGIIITKTNVVTVCLNEVSVITDMVNGFVKGLQTNLKTQFLLFVLLKIAQSFLLRLKTINKITGQIENQLQKTMKNKDFMQLLGMQKSLVYFSTSLKANQLTLEKIFTGRILKLYEEDQDLLEDVMIEFKQAVEMSNIYSSILDSTTQACSAIINNNMNSIMKVLTIITILMQIPNIIFAFYGMNMNDGLQYVMPYTWFAILLSVVSVGIVVFVLWKKKF